jgi:hypothetical protein
MDLGESDCEGGKWIQMAQDHEQWLDLVLLMSNLYDSGLCPKALALVVSTHQVLIPYVLTADSI